MRRALEALLAVLLAAVALPAASVHHLPIPEGFSEAEEAQHYQSMLDATWDASPASAIYDRPVVEPGEPLASPLWESSLRLCLDLAGFRDVVPLWLDDRGMSAIDATTAGDASLDAQLAFYSCLAQAPRDMADQELLSEAQIEYLYSDYKRWLMPCLKVHGYRTQELPSYELFVASHGTWSPYLWQVRDARGEELDDLADYNLMIARCGQDWPNALRG